ncbi:hypothetical protein SAMN05661080_04607 [Modestobacter sp. DSM 44400]|nr:hypothetical protein SAMN05661080_04607 [Modestobacter sp. DSM 44400]
MATPGSLANAAEHRQIESGRPRLATRTTKVATDGVLTPRRPAGRGQGPEPVRDTMRDPCLEPAIRAVADRPDLSDAA